MLYSSETKKATEIMLTSPTLNLNNDCTIENWMILDETRTNTRWDNMGSNSEDSEWKENFRLPQPTPGLFLLAEFCFSLSRQQTAC